MTPGAYILIGILGVLVLLLWQMRRGLKMGAMLLRINSPGTLDDHYLLCATTVDELFYGIFITDAAGKIVLVNRQGEKMSGYTRRELMDQQIEMLLPEDRRERHVQQRNDYSVDGGTRPMGSGLDTQMRRKNGAHIPVDIALNTFTVPGANGGTRHVATVRRRPAN
nr:sensory box histidine kinase [uncultured bacterium]